MPCSPARLLANQQNAQRSTGPKTAEGKARSRGNALKHGLTGQGIVQPDDAAAEIARRSAELQAEMRPSGRLSRIMVHRIAFLSVRLERSGEQELAAIGRSVRHSQDNHDAEADAQVAALFTLLDDQPATAVRRLLMTPHGIDATIQAWIDLKADLARSNARFWTAAHCERANLLTGRRMNDIPLSRINELSHAIWGDFGLLDEDEGAELDDKARQAWAKERLVEWIDDEITALGECRETLDLEAFELDRAEAGQRALFDTSREASLARRYEAAAERGMFRALKEFREIETQAAENPPPSIILPQPPLGSFGAAEVEPEMTDETAEIEPEEPLLELARRVFPPLQRPGTVEPPKIDSNEPIRSLDGEFLIKESG